MQNGIISNVRRIIMTSAFLTIYTAFVCKWYTTCTAMQYKFTLLYQSDAFLLIIFTDIEVVPSPSPV